jgi:hypothetical protein
MKEEEVGARAAKARERAGRERVERLELALKELEKVREGKKKNLKEKGEARVSETDPEARVMKHGDGGFSPSYNLQMGVDATEKIIVGVGISQSSADQGELMRGVDRVAENMARAPGEVVADGAYTTMENIVEMEGRGIGLIGPVIDRERRRRLELERTGVKAEFFPEAFHYHEGRNIYRCPEGKELKYWKKENQPGTTFYLYRAQSKDCVACPFRDRCCPKRAEKGRVVRRVVDAPEITAFNQKMKSEEAKEIYKKRGEVAEFPHAWIKDKLKLRQFRLRGVRKVELEAVWACLTYNIQQWIRLKWKPMILSGLDQSTA